MTDDTHNATASVFAAFIEADKALKELPAVKSALAETEALANAYATDLDRERAETERLRQALAELRDDLADTKSALSLAEARQTQANTLLTSLRGLLGFGTDPTTTLGQSAMSPTIDGSPDTFATPQPSEASVNALPDTSTGQSDADPTPTVNSTDTPQPVAAPQTATTETVADYMTDLTSANPTEVANSATHDAFPPDLRSPNELSTPTASSGDTNSPADGTPTPNAGPSGDVNVMAMQFGKPNLAPEPEPSLAKRHWGEKPYWVNWSDWASRHNGEVPHWVRDEDMTNID